MAYPAGAVQLTGFIGTTDVTDVFPTHLDFLGFGGYRSVVDITERDAITHERRVFGMLVGTQDQNPPVVYILANSVMGGVDNNIDNNANWIVFSAGGGGGGGSGTIFIDQTPDDGTYGLLIGDVDGINDAFTVSQGEYSSGILAVFLNGVLQLQGATDDWFEVDPATGTFSFVTPPPVDSIITALYTVPTTPTPTLTLETNGVLNGDQTLLNLIAGDGMMITDDGSGGVTFDVIGGSTIYVDQTPDDGTYGLLAGLVDGSNDLYTVSQGLYLTGKLSVYLNGVFQLQGPLDDWQETDPSTGTFTFNIPPAVDSIISVQYITTAGGGGGGSVTSVGLALPSIFDVTVSPITTTGDLTAVFTDPGADSLIGWDDTDGDAVYFTIGGGLSYDHSTHTISASGTPLSLEVDGTPNTDQSLLNLIAGTGITLTDDGFGGVTIDNTASITTGDLTDVGTDGIVITGGTGAVVGSGTSIAQHVADSTHNGYLSSTDWSTFNSKQSSLSFGNLTDAGTDGITITGGTGSVIGSGTSISQHVADSTHNGYLSSTDWSTFNSKGAGSVTSVDMSVPTGLSISGNPITSSGTLALTLTAGYVIPTTTEETNWNTAYTNRITSLTVTGSSGSATLILNTLNIPTYTLAGLGGITLTDLSATTPIFYDNTTGVFTIQVANTSQSGYLTSTDWNTFNGKQASGNYITALTGDGTASGPGSVALTLATVNSNVGTFGSATQVGQFTVNAKGLVTAASNVTITPAASSITGGAALTKTDDTNVTLTLGGTPTTALLAAASLTLGWTGLLSVARGGTGIGSTTAYGVLLGGTTSTGAFQNAGTGTTGQLLKSNGASAVPTWQTPTTEFITFTIDGQGGTITASNTLYGKQYRVPVDCTVGDCLINVGLGVTGSFVFDIKRNGTSIVGGGNKPTVTTNTSSTTTPSGWTSTALVAGDLIEVVGVSNTACTAITLTIKTS